MGLKISELQSILSKASSLLGDAPVILKDIESEVETDIKGLEVLITSGDASEAGTVTVVHGEPAPAPVADPSAADTPAAP